MREQALQQAHAEGLTLRLSANNATGYAGVCKLSISHRHKPYQAMVKRGGKQVSLGSFAIAEEAALCVARSPEGKAAAERRAAEAALPEQALQRQRDATIKAVALEIIYQAAEAAAIELGTEVAAEVMAGIALGL